MPERAYSQEDQTSAPRSFHFIPATLLQNMDPARLVTLGADTTVLDLEDSVRPEDREQAREWLSGFIDDGRVPEGLDICVRINMPGSEWWDRDFEAFDGRVPLMIPRISSLKDIPVNAKSEITPLLETLSAMDLAPGLADMRDAEGRPKISAVIFGKEDLLADLGHINTDPNSTNPIPSTDLRTNTVLRELFSYIRWGTPNDLRVYDGVTKHLMRGDGVSITADLADECAYARSIGAAGKSSIHPSQVATINEVFDASNEIAVEPQPGIKPELAQDVSAIPNRDEKLRNAERIVKLFTANERAQITTALDIDGVKTMVGPPVYRLAQAILAAEAR